MNEENKGRSLPPDARRSLPSEASPAADTDESQDDAFTLDWRKLLISVFVVWQIFAVAVWLLPTSALQMNLAALVRPYMMLSGGWQAWTMFSPSPSNTDMYLKAVIEYKDGSTRNWDFPRMDRLDLWSKYREERWRKAIENMESDDGRGYWPYLARYAAMQNDPQPQINPPVEVRLTRNFRLIPPPGVQMPPFTNYEFYTQAITPALLRGDTLLIPPLPKPVKSSPEQKTGPLVL